jgi:hypothetical protein
MSSAKMLSKKMSSEKIRLLVLSVFLMALIIFALAYRPADASGHPAGEHKAADVVRPVVPRK